jgi:hypothetical protein
VLLGEAGEALLDTYEAERRPIATMIVDTSLHNMKQRMRPDLDVSGLTPPVEPFAGMLGFCYSSTAVLREVQSTERTENPLEPTGRPGFRAPDVAITRNGSTNQSTVDLFGHGWVLLTAFGGEPWRDAAADISAEICVGIACHIEGTDFTGELSPWTRRWRRRPGPAGRHGHVAYEGRGRRRRRHPVERPRPCLEPLTLLQGEAVALRVHEHRPPAHGCSTGFAGNSTPLAESSS